MEIKLKPCPFCGKNPKHLDTPSGIFAKCSDELCVAGLGDFFYCDTWNYRPLENKLKKAIDKLTSAMDLALDNAVTHRAKHARLKFALEESRKILGIVKTK